MTKQVKKNVSKPSSKKVKASTSKKVIKKNFLKNSSAKENKKLLAEERIYGLKEMIHGMLIGLAIGFIIGIIIFKGSI